MGHRVFFDNELACMSAMSGTAHAPYIVGMCLCVYNFTHYLCAVVTCLSLCPCSLKWKVLIVRHGKLVASQHFELTVVHACVCVWGGGGMCVHVCHLRLKLKLLAQ